MVKKILNIFLIAIIIISVCPVQTKADEKEEERYYFSEVVNTGKDNGYSKKNEIKKDDPHFGWKLGEFFVEGFTRYELDEDGNPVFLKKVGDEVILWFDLQQSIGKLNGNDSLYICDDKNGYDEKFDIQQTNFKKGTLIIRHTDYQNNVGEPQIYTNYLSAKASKDADTEVLICEEGDYEVSLLYEIKNNGFWFWDSYYNYRIDFEFSIRNGNTMVFPFDVATGEELTNCAYTENGFYLDMANTKYLTIDIKKEVLQDGVEGLVEDIRFNRPAADGEEFTEEGIYTITVKNDYTEVVTEKKIYVGSNSILKAHVVTGLSIAEIQAQVDEGATISNEGLIIPLSSQEPENEMTTKEKTVVIENKKTNKGENWIPVIVIVVIIISALSVVIVRNKRMDNKNTEVKTKEEMSSNE